MAAIAVPKLSKFPIFQWSGIAAAAQGVRQEVPERVRLQVRVHRDGGAGETDGGTFDNALWQPSRRFLLKPV